MDLYLIAIKDFFVMVKKHRKYGKKIRAKKKLIISIRTESLKLKGNSLNSVLKCPI